MSVNQKNRPDPGARHPVTQLVAEVVANRADGAYQVLRLAAPEVAAAARPGQFVALAVGGPTTGNLLRRCFSIHRVGDDSWVEVVVAAHEPGTVWLAAVAVGAGVDVVGPLGRPFPLPAEPVPCVLVGGGYGSAPLFWLADALRARGCHVELILGAATRGRLFGVDRAGEHADGLTVTTDDGSLGSTGLVTDAVPTAIQRSSAAVVYGCGPMSMLAAVTTVATAQGAVAQVAVEEAMACGVGVCMTCVLPVVGSDGRTRMVRSCVEGPVFRGDRIRWDAFVDGYGQVPDDAVGAPGGVGAGGGH